MSLEDVNIWGCEKPDDDKIPDEVLDAVLADIDIAFEYPHIYEKAEKMKREREQKQ